MKILAIYIYFIILLIYQNLFIKIFKKYLENLILLKYIDPKIYRLIKIKKLLHLYYEVNRSL